MNQHNKRNKLFSNFEIIKHTTQAPDGWYAISRYDLTDHDTDWCVAGNIKPPQFYFIAQRVIALAVIEDWDTDTVLPSQYTHPITSDNVSSTDPVDHMFVTMVHNPEWTLTKYFLTEQQYTALLGEDQFEFIKTAYKVQS